VAARLRALWRNLVRRKRVDRDLEEEVRGAYEQLVEDKIRAGLAPADAKRAATLEFGGTEGVKDRVRDARAGALFHSLGKDVSYALRGFRRNPGFAAVAIGTLTLGIGANTAIFSLIHGVLVRPMPYMGSDRLVRIFEHLPPRRGVDGIRRESPLANSDLAAFRTQTTTLSHVGVELPMMTTMAREDGLVRLVGVSLSADLVSMLGAQPLLGRTLDARDEAPGATAVVVLSAATWERYFGRDPAIVGKSLDVGGSGYLVVGVMPPDFLFPEGHPEFWIPFVPPTSGPDMRQRLPLIARVKEGVSIQQATAEVSALIPRLRGDPSGNAAGSENASRFSLVVVQDLLVAPVKPSLLVLSVTVAFVLLIACVNVANLLLARTTVRQHEIAIRLALGAGRGRLIRQLLTESMLLALIGGAAGTLLAAAGLHVLRVLAAGQPDIGPGVIMPRLGEVGIDLPVWAFTFALSALAGVVFGLAPAVSRSSDRSAHALYEGKAAVSGPDTLQQRRIQSVLVVAEIALAMMLLVGAGLLLRSFSNLSNVWPGYDPRGVLTLKVALPPARSDAWLGTFAEDLVARLRTLPRVRSAGYGESLPLVRIGRLAWLGITPDMPSDPDQASRLGTTGRTVSVRVVSRDFLPAMATRVVAGRALAESDGRGQPQVMLINRTLARSVFLEGQALEKRLYILGSVTFDPRRRNPEAGAPLPWQIVGIVEDVRQASLDQEPGPEIFVDFRQLPGPSGPPGSPRYVVMRIDGDETAVATSARSVAHQLDSEALVEDVRPMAQLVSTSMARPRLNAVLLGLFAAVAATLASIGLYGVMAYAVTQRTREIGIRMAVGAQQAQVMKLILSRSVGLIVIGIIIGLAAAAAMSRYLQGMLFGLASLDPTTFLSVAAIFAFVALLATYLPARRAAKVDPVIALRCE
jgi:putative ABC transport system permease protein